MTSPAAGQAISPPDGARPALHFTAPSHWLNDPHGLCWAGGEYHLFYQHHTGGNVWSADIVWGHATSADLVRWRHQPIALRPEPAERGCWSGAVLVEDDRPTILYTSVAGEDWDIGRVAVARPDVTLRHWASARSPDVEVLIEGPPESLGAIAFRDPCLVRTADGWALVIGVGVASGAGLVVQWVSADSVTWTYDGVVCSRPGDADDVWTGSMWECPQLFRLEGDTWALVVSVWDAGRLNYNAVAVGTYNGHRFVAERWSRLTHDENAYAMTSFQDRDGQPAVMFWLREDADHAPDAQAWSGALSLPMVAELTADRQVRLAPHRDVDTLRHGGVHPTDDAAWPLDGGGLDLLVLSTGGVVVVTVGGVEVIRLRVAPAAVTVHRPQRPDSVVPVADPTVRIIVDTGIVVIHGGLGCGTVRYDAVGPAEVTVHAVGATVQRLAAAG
ncbi:MAG: glycoside hydrolase family 32 protein [Nakamurella sp.]